MNEDDYEWIKCEPGVLLTPLVLDELGAIRLTEHHVPRLWPRLRLSLHLFRLPLFPHRFSLELNKQFQIHISCRRRGYCIMHHTRSHYSPTEPTIEEDEEEQAYANKRVSLLLTQ